MTDRVLNPNSSFKGRKRRYAGRGGSNYNKRHRKEPDQKRAFRKPAGDLLKVLADTELEAVKEDVQIEDCEYVASYNWLDCEEPIIVVPGAPPVISKEPMPKTKLAIDTDPKLIDPNGAKCPDHPFDPVVRAISLLRPNLDTSSMDVVACNRTLGYLLAFADGRFADFRFDAELVGTTLFLTRRENPPNVCYPLHGFSQSFAKERTQWEEGLENSSTHQRLMKYKLGGLNVMIRYEVDGYFNDEEDNALCDELIESGSSGEQTKTEADDKQNPPPLKEALSSSPTRNPLSQVRISAHSSIPALDIVLQVGGKAVKRAYLVDMRTRSRENPLDRDEVDRRAWLKQIPNMVIGYHESGVFEDPEIHSVGGRAEIWQKKNAQILGKLVDVLGKLRACTERAWKQEDLPIGKVEVSRCSGDVLEIRKLEEEDKRRSALSDKMKEKWISGVTKAVA